MYGLILSRVWDIDCLSVRAFRLGAVPGYRSLHPILKVNGRLPAQLFSCFGIVSYATRYVDASRVWVPVNLCLDPANFHYGLDYLLDGSLYSATKVIDFCRPTLLR